MSLKVVLRRQVFVLAVFAPLFAIVTLFLKPAAICIEGGTVVGFPWGFYNQCYTGSGQQLGLAEFLPLPLCVDVATWYLASAGLVFLFRLAAHR